MALAELARDSLPACGLDMTKKWERVLYEWNGIMNGSLTMSLDLALGSDMHVQISAGVRMVPQ